MHTTERYSPVVRERAVRLVQEQARDHRRRQAGEP